MDDKETHAVSVACCRGRPPSSSHFRVSEQQRNDCLFSPSAPAGACSGLSSGPWRPGSSLPGCLPPSCCQWGATSPPVPPFNTVHCMLRQRRSSALEKRSAFELRLQMLQLQLQRIELLIICGLTNGAHGGSKSKFVMTEPARGCLAVVSEELRVCPCSDSRTHA